METRSSYRFESIDLLRGLVMIIMALDHTRDFFHIKAMTDSPLNMATTTPVFFFTRWITHFCAPVFVFLSGTSIYFQSLRKSKKELSIFLLKRGLWLILLEVTLVNFGFSFNIYFNIIALQVIWAIGISMVILALMIWLPFQLLLAIGLLIVVGHNSLDFYEANIKNVWWYDLLHKFGFYKLWENHSLIILYPFLPWTGLMLVGYCFGKLFTSKQGAEKRKMLTWMGVGVILFFIILRASNLYGDPSHWSKQRNLTYTILSFLNTTKYPPSLLFMCMTIGPALLFLAWMENVKNGFTEFVTVYGRVPFFYFVVHFYLIHLACMILFLARGHAFAEGYADPNNITNFVVRGEGYSLGIVYLIWLGVVLTMYPLCYWYGKYKQTHNHWWLSYL